MDPVIRRQQGPADTTNPASPHEPAAYELEAFPHVVRLPASSYSSSKSLWSHCTFHPPLHRLNLRLLGLLCDFSQFVSSMCPPCAPFLWVDPSTPLCKEPSAPFNPPKLTLVWVPPRPLASMPAARLPLLLLPTTLGPRKSRVRPDLLLQGK